jgi:tripartite-type tricarboxylate transporter receptor subunit TctC
MNIMKMIKCFASVMLTVVMSAAYAQPNTAFPSKPITLVIPFPPGSISDTLGRAVADRVSKSLGQAVVIDNKPGANGAIGATFALRAQADGHTVLMASNGIVILNKLLTQNLTYDPAQLSPLALAAEVPAVLIAKKALPATDLRSLIELAKRTAGGLSYATGQATTQVAGEALKDAAGINLTHVPYRGEPQGLTDVVGGQVDLMLVNLPVAAAQINSGGVKAIALIGGRKVASMPQLDLASSQLPAYVMPNGWTGFFASSAVPTVIRERLSKEFLDALSAPEIRQRVEATPGTMLTSENPVQFAARIQSESAIWERLIKSMKTPIQQ